MLLDSRYFAPFMISAERLGQLNSHVISNTLKELDAALTSPEVAHEEIVVVKENDLGKEIIIEQNIDDLIPEPTTSFVNVDDIKEA
jgi:hypothetical protein